MTKSEFISDVRNAIAGGIVNEDIYRKFPDQIIENQLVKEINASILQTYYAGREDGVSEFPSNFIATYPLTIQSDTTQGRKYATIPTKIFAMPRNRGIRGVFPIKGDTMFVQTSRLEMALNKYYASSFDAVTLYFPEAEKIWFVNLDGLVEEVLGLFVVPITEIGEDEEMPVPAGFEAEITRRCVDFFLNVRKTPVDMSNDNLDNPTPR